MAPGSCDRQSCACKEPFATLLPPHLCDEVREGQLLHTGPSQCLQAKRSFPSVRFVSPHQRTLLTVSRGGGSAAAVQRRKGQQQRSAAALRSHAARRDNLAGKCAGGRRAVHCMLRTAVLQFACRIAASAPQRLVLNNHTPWHQQLLVSSLGCCQSHTHSHNSDTLPAENRPHCASVSCHR